MHLHASDRVDQVQCPRILYTNLVLELLENDDFKPLETLSDNCCPNGTSLLLRETGPQGSLG